MACALEFANYLINRIKLKLKLFFGQNSGKLVLIWFLTLQKNLKSSETIYKLLIQNIFLYHLDSDHKFFLSRL
jgi:hypothetical protein